MIYKLRIKISRDIYEIPWQDVIYFEKDLRKIRVHTVKGNIEYYGKFTDLEPDLDERFLYCHRSYIFNMDEITEMEDERIVLSNDDIVHFGRGTYSKAKKIFSDYVSGKKT